MAIYTLEPEQGILRGLLMSIQSQNPFKWCHFEAEIILLCVRWYLRVRHVTHHCIPSEKECQK
ncbi:MAG TPA: hypothetical protein VGN34_13410 [Ktedonobacteraceae bacterium]